MNHIHQKDQQLLLTIPLKKCPHLPESESPPQVEKRM
jgi:hypothetical protein